MGGFSFPIIGTDQGSTLCPLPFPHFATSPLWFLSSATAHHHHQSLMSGEDTAEATQDLKDRNMEEPAVSNNGEDQFVDEERMDKLWEDFNEELYPASCNQKGGIEKKSDAQHDGAVELCCVQTLGMPVGINGMFHHRRPSLLTMLKVLKKLFFIQKAGSRKRT